MKVHIEIGELVLQGFDYHDHIRIGTAFEQELTRLIRENGLPKGFVHQLDTTKIEAGSFKAPIDMNPRNIGAEIGRSIYRGLKR